MLSVYDRMEPPTRIQEEMQIPFVERSSFLAPAVDAIGENADKLGRGERASFSIGDGTKKGYEGDVIVSVGSSSEGFETDWNGTDATRFPARIRAVATALRKLNSQGTYSISHQHGSVEVELINLRTTYHPERPFNFTLEDPFRFGQFHILTTEQKTLECTRSPNEMFKNIEHALFDGTPSFQTLTRPDDVNKKKFLSRDHRGGEFAFGLLTFGHYSLVVDHERTLVWVKFTPSDTTDHATLRELIDSAKHRTQLDKKVLREFLDKENWKPPTSGNSEPQAKITTYGESDYYRMQKTRLGQSTFRKQVLDNFGHACCISGISESRLLVASHIVPWAENEQTRLDPANGLCLFVTFDALFDQGYISFGDDLEVLTTNSRGSLSKLLDELDGTKARFPTRTDIGLDYLKWHRENVFIDR